MSYIIEARRAREVVLGIGLLTGGFLLGISLNDREATAPDSAQTQEIITDLRSDINDLCHDLGMVSMQAGELLDQTQQTGSNTITTIYPDRRASTCP